MICRIEITTDVASPIFIHLVTDTYLFYAWFSLQISFVIGHVTHFVCLKKIKYKRKKLQTLGCLLKTASDFTRDLLALTAVKDSPPWMGWKQTSKRKLQAIPYACCPPAAWNISPQWVGRCLSLCTTPINCMSLNTKVWKHKTCFLKLLQLHVSTWFKVLTHKGSGCPNALQSWLTREVPVRMLYSIAISYMIHVHNID